MNRRLKHALLFTPIAFAAWALPVDRGIVEDGTDTSAAEGRTDGGMTLNKRNGTTRLRPATCTAGSCTRLAPDAGAEGFDLENISALRVTVCAPGAATLGGSGTVELWAWEPSLQNWAHMPSKDLSVTLTGERCQAWPVELNSHRAAGFRFLARPNDVSVPGTDGGSLLVSVQGCAPAVPTAYAIPGCGQ